MEKKYKLCLNISIRSTLRTKTLQFKNRQTTQINKRGIFIRTKIELHERSNVRRINDESQHSIPKTNSNSLHARGSLLFPVSTCLHSDTSFRLVNGVPARSFHGGLRTENPGPNERPLPTFILPLFSHESFRERL